MDGHVALRFVDLFCDATIDFDCDFDWAWGVWSFGEEAEYIVYLF